MRLTAVLMSLLIFTAAFGFAAEPDHALDAGASRQIIAAKNFLYLPVKNGAKVHKVKVSAEGQAVREFTIEAADGEPDWWASLDISAWRGKTLDISIDKVPPTSHFLDSIEQGDRRVRGDSIYHEALRPQFHFSPARGWNNDPNGLVYYRGEYHMFFQFNPYGTKWGNMHWGHAVSSDLLHWKELDTALYPDRFGPMYSGSAVVDWNNTSGLGTGGKPPMVLAYTAAGAGIQCIASSIDGRTFTKFDGNPVVNQIAKGNRDPKIIWHAPTRSWVMALYVGVPLERKQGQDKAAHLDTIHFLTSPDLKHWTLQSQIEGFFECPDLFPLPLDGDAKNVKWILTAASSDYMIGQFDGRTFTPETPKLKGHRGEGFYAAQTFSDLPNARRVMIGWFKTPSPGMAFNQSMTVPLEITLRSTPGGPRLSYLPVKELEQLRQPAEVTRPPADGPNPSTLATTTGDALDLRLTLTPGAASVMELNVHGLPIQYDVREQVLVVGKLKATAPLNDGKLDLTVLVDRNSVEIFADHGLTYVPYPYIAKDGDTAVRLSANGAVGAVNFSAFKLKSIWE